MFSSVAIFFERYGGKKMCWSAKIFLKGVW